MLKANVGLSRKLSHDYNSTGFSVNLEAEICAPLDDPTLVIAKIAELYDLAEESLNLQIERHEVGSVTQAARLTPVAPPALSSSPSPPTNGNGSAVSPSNGSKPAESGEFVPATNKQISFLLNLGKRQGLNKPQLENRISALIGRRADIYELSKQEAGRALDDLTKFSNTSEPQHRQ